MKTLIQFSGVIPDTSRVYSLCGDLADISLAQGWLCDWVEAVEVGVVGVVLSGVGMEPLPFLFDSTGNLHDLSVFEGDEQSGGMVAYDTTSIDKDAVHYWVAGLLRFLKIRYIPELVVNDSSGFWDSEDEGGETPDGIADQLAAMLTGIEFRRHIEMRRLSYKQSSIYRFLQKNEYDGYSDVAEDEQEDRVREYLKACETATRTTYAKMLITCGVELPMPADLDEDELHRCLWRVIHVLGELHIFFESTDHLSERELYERLWLDVLNQEIPDVRSELESAWCVDLAGSGSSEDIDVYLRYYAPEDERRHYAGEYPDMQIPPREEPAYKRAHLLPKMSG